MRAIIQDSKDRVLLLRRKKGSACAGQWCLPGGKVGYKETVANAVVREVAEETGMRCLEAAFLFYQDSMPIEPNSMHCINLYFRCSVKGKVKLNHESSTYAWVAPSELKDHDIAFRNDDGLQRFFGE